MMKYTGGLSLTLGIVFAVPAMTLGGGLPDSVETALGQTLRSLEVLGQLNKQLEAGKPLPPEALQQVTEAPLGDTRSRDEHFEALRDEVSELHSKIDAKKIASTIPLNTLTQGAPQTLNLSEWQAQFPVLVDTDEPLQNLTRHVSPGLSETFIKALGAGQYATKKPLAGQTNGLGANNTKSPTKSPSIKPDLQTAATQTDATGTTTNSITSPIAVKGYSADPLRQAQACYRAGRYDQGVAILATVDPNPTVNYWKARLFEKTGRISEAIELFQQVETNDAAGELRESAKREREFAEWRRDFEKRADVKSSTETKKLAPNTKESSQ